MAASGPSQAPSPGDASSSRTRSCRHCWLSTSLTASVQVKLPSAMLDGMTHDDSLDAPVLTVMERPGQTLQTGVVLPGDHVS